MRSTPDEASTAAKDEGRSEDLETLRRELELANTRRPLEGVKEAVSKVPLPSMTIDTSKPFRFPAYGFLGIAVLLGISFTGSCVELAGGKPLVSQWLSSGQGEGPMYEDASGLSDPAAATACLPPQLGVLPTEAIIALSGPGALGVFFLAVQRFNQEAEEDNERYLKEEERKEAGYDDEDEEE